MMEWFILLCSFAPLLAHATATSCSLGNRVSNLLQCLGEIKAVASNDSAFWFGSQYSTLCPNGSADPSQFECFNPSNASNLFSRIFGPSFAPTAIDRFLTMEFTSPAGTYSGCGNSYSTNTTWKSDIDPLSGLVVTPWQTRFLPYLQWATLPGEMFTFVVYDVGYLFTQAIYTNVRGNDFSLADVTFKYRGPGNPGPRENIYVFMIFRQSGQVSVPASWQNKLSGGINFTEMMKEWNLSGPIAVNWLTVVGDEYAVQKTVNAKFANMCPYYEGLALSKMNVPSYVPKSVQLKVGITATYHSNAIDFTACCSTHKYSQETFALNPLGNPIYNTYKVSQKPTVTLLKKGFYPGITNFTGDLYTLMMVDANTANPVVGNATHPMLYWLVTNIKDGSVSNGQEYVSYLGPDPRDRKPHTYYYLLYKQQASLPVSTFYPYTSHCANPLGRCLFNIDALVADKNLQLVGATWLWSTTDIYVAFQRIYSAGQSVSQWCSGMQGYKGDPSCPAGLSTVVHPGVLVG